METETQYTTLDESHIHQEASDSSGDELMSTFQDSGQEYMTSIGDTPTDIDLSGAQVAGLAAILGVYFVFLLAVLIASIVVFWKIFTKAGQAGWKSLIPFYNIYVLLQIIGRPGWWLLLFFIPFVNIVPAVIVSIDLAKSFGKSTAFGVVALFLFSYVGYFMLAFGSAQYVGPAAATATPATPTDPTPEAAPPAAPAV